MSYFNLDGSDYKGSGNDRRSPANQAALLTISPRGD
jgi:hypothetical protein